MSEMDAAARLVRAARLGGVARRNARWYVGYLLAFGVASFALACVFAFVGGVAAVAITTPLWVLFVVVLSVWERRHRVTIRGFGVLHGVVIGAWSAVWLVVVLVGTTALPYAWWWWFCGGLAMAAVAFAGAVVAYRRSGA